MELTELLEILKTMSSLRQNFTEIITQGVGTKPGPQPAMKAASLGRGTSGAVALVGQKGPGTDGGCAPGMSPAGSPGSRLRAWLPAATAGLQPGPGGVAGLQGASLWEAFRLRVPHIPRLEW